MPIYGNAKSADTDIHIGCLSADIIGRYFYRLFSSMNNMLACRVPACARPVKLGAKLQRAYPTPSVKSCNAGFMPGSGPVRHNFAVFMSDLVRDSSYYVLHLL